MKNSFEEVLMQLIKQVQYMTKIPFLDDYRLEIIWHDNRW